MGDLARQHLRPSARARAARTLASALILTAAALAQAPAPSQPSYFEFGSVVSLGQHTIDIQTFDAQKKRTVQHSFFLARETRADLVHVGDTVEVIFTPGSTPSGEWTVRRLILLNAGIPQAGPPSFDHREVPAPVSARIAPPPPAAKVPTPIPTTRTAASAAKTTPTPKPAASIDLGSTASARPSTATTIPLGAMEAAPAKVLAPRGVAFEVPLAECNRSSADWPTQPLRLAVLDFRYPTEREEAHDVGSTGGGSGTAVADLIYARLDQLNTFAMMRGDRTRLYRADFAGAARAGREIGADAVLAGTFAPEDPPPGSDPEFPPPKQYELHAGIVDTCTGQLLLRLTSVTCKDGADPNQPANAALCKRFSVTAKQATDPKDQARAFAMPIDALLNPLVHNGPPPGTQGTAGVVIDANAANVSIKLPSGSAVKPGDQVAVHAWGLTKNPTTYTLNNLHDQEIGRVTITNVHNDIATGTFTGDFPPQTGDTAELITQ
jgi:hypothetical protein